MIQFFKTKNKRLTNLRARLLLLGPAFVAAIAYVDPGNVATNTTAGSKYGYMLLWVIIVVNIMAGLVQYLSAKVGLVTGKSLPEVVRDRLPRPARLAYWAQAEVVAVATDIAEVLGGAIALNLLFGLPLVVGGIITGIISMILLMVQTKRGQQPFERIIVGMLMIIAVGFVAGLFVQPASPAGIVNGLIPRFDGTDSVLLAAGMIGATIMPHVVYLHSALARDRHGKAKDRKSLKILLKATRFDVILAMLFAGGINIAMLLLAASSLQGIEGTETIEGAHQAVQASLGPIIATFFAVGLLASGLASTSVGCYAGAVIMEGLLRRKFSLLLRRAITLIPALILLVAGIEPTFALIISQVVLSFGIPFAVIPLVMATSSHRIMGKNKNSKLVTLLASGIAAVVVALNVTLIGLMVTGA